MKTRSAIIFIYLIISSTLHSQPCIPSGIQLSTQSEVDNFVVNYPNCTEIGGNVIIGIWSGSDITNLFGLSVITSIGGDLEIRHNDSLTDLWGLHNLVTIGDRLWIGGVNPYWGNYSLTNLAGLNSLASVGDIIISGNENLLSLEGLESLIDIEQNSIQLAINPSLISLSGMENLNTSNLYIHIDHCDALENLQGLECFSSMGGFYIGYNDALSSLSGLDNITTIANSMWIVGNNEITNLQGLENLSYLGGSLFINGNDSLSDLGSLGELTYLGGELSITVNHHLTSLSGLENIASEEIDSLKLISNHSLSECEVQSICAYLSLPNSVAKIIDNYQGCNSIEEVEEACESFDIEDNVHDIRISIFPNPATDILQISTNKESKIETINIYNQFGQRVFSKEGISKNIDISDLDQGIYIIELVTSEMRSRHKVIIEE